MARNRAVLAALGAIAATVGLATVVSPSLAAVLAIPELPVTVVGGIAGVFGLVVGLRRRASVVRGGEPPPVESVTEHPVPGAAFDAGVRGAGGLGVDAARSRRERREHLAAVAVDVITTVEGCSDAEAEARLADGSWTDDPIAAACFADERPELGLRGAFAQYLDGRSRYEREFAHAIEALDRRLAGETPS